jgi:hypothetical protein
MKEKAFRTLTVSSEPAYGVRIKNSPRC